MCLLYHGKGGSNSFIPGSSELIHKGRGDCTDDVTKTVYTTDLEKAETGKGVLN
jgi:hypothetical protein